MPAAFKADQKVKYDGMSMPATIISGPHATHGEDRWLIRKADNKVSLVKQSALSVFADRREIVAEAIFKRLVGGRWAVASAITRSRYLSAAGDVLAALDTQPLAVGDKVRILKSGLEHASVSAGDVLAVTRVSDKTFRTEAPGFSSGAGWEFSYSGHGTGWERW